MPLIVDAHQDLAYNALAFGRDYSRSAHATRASEKDGWPPTVNGECLLGLPEYLSGQVAIIFNTLFASPRRGPLAEGDKLPSYGDANEAHKVYARQLDYYARLTDEHPQFRPIRARGDLETVLASWQVADETQRRVGLVTLMEGADGIREPQEAEWWLERGVRVVGLAWSATRYAGGTNAPGPLTPAGRQLLNIMADLGLILDLSHASDESYLEALDRFPGVVIASHSNPRACLKDPRRPERFLTDEMIRRLAERGGVVGIVPYNSFLRSDWKVSDGKTIPLEDVIKMIDHVCQVTGSAAHVGLGSDFDGGFGVASTPTEIDTVADLQKIGPALTARGYSANDVAAILGQNWIEILRRGLPA